MSAATMEKPKRMVAAPAKTITFMSRRSDLKLVISRKWDRKDGEGNILETIPGEHIKFEEGVLRVPPKGQVRGEHGESLDAAKVLLFLEGDEENGRLPHPLLGDRFDGFWRHEEAPPVPTEAERDKLAELGMDLDVEGLRTFIEQEQAGWAREDLLALAKSSLERAEAKVAERDTAIAEAEARGAAAASKPADGDGPKGGKS